jgi:tRNA-specific 2-thiouridylase
VTERLKKDIIKLLIDEVVIEGESVKIFATIPLPNKIHEREMDKTDIPGTFNAGATLGPVNETNMARIWNKHKQSNTPLKRKVFVMMSGGVDSSVAAALLKESGEFDVVGAHIICWKGAAPGARGCSAEDDAEDARRVADKLNIPFYVFDLTAEYKAAVFDYMLREYQAGRTPNPDVMCNSEIKFGVFLKKALALGADFVATGHYVRREPEFPIINDQFSNSAGDIKNLDIENSLKIENCKLKIAKDTNKDQSYFLWKLNQEQLARAIFPIGEMLKPQVREAARKFNLPTAEKKDSQGLCFVGQTDFAALLRAHLPIRKGKVVTTDGRVVGEHDGTHFYTIGQRHGLNLGSTNKELGIKGEQKTLPYFVSAKDAVNNKLIVAQEGDTELARREITVNEAHWIAGIAPVMPLECSARIRYRQPLVSCAVNLSNTECLTVKFGTPVRGVAPGQSVVFYDGETLLGGAVISE